MKLYNLSIPQTASKFNMNYRILSRCCKKISEVDYLHENIPVIQVSYVESKQILLNLKNSN